MKRRFNIWAAFVAFIFVILLSTGLLSFFLFIAVTEFGLLDNIERPFINPLAFILFISVILGTLLSAFSGKRMMKFVYQLRDAIKQVAAGDFSVQIQTHNQIGEVDTLISDFNKMVKDLGSIETLKDDFITNVSHEIKTPIASIKGCIELLKDQSLTEDEMKEYINLMEISVKRLSVLTANILRLSKLDNQEILPERTEFSLDEQIRQAILLLERQWSAKNINLNINLNPARVVANKELLMQVWTNLIENAIKFSNENSDINIELYQADGKLYVKVIDFGIGMKDETIKHIFQKFYQGNESRSNQGNGLGLALARRIVELSNGNITVESQLGKGSIFIVDLPIVE
jgi:signal transduction histidine kinase